MDRLGPVSPVSGGCLILPCPVASAGEECVWSLFLSWVVEPSLEGLLQNEGKGTQTRFCSMLEPCSFLWSGLTHGTKGKALGVCKHGCRASAFSLHSPHPLRGSAAERTNKQQQTMLIAKPQPQTLTEKGCLNSGKPYG